MSSDFTERQIDNSEKIVIRDESTQKVQTVIFPHTTQVGLGDDRYQSKLNVQGSIHSSGSLQLGELSTTPEQPGDGSGGIFYVKSDGKPYFRSYEQAEVDLTTSGGGSGDITGVDLTGGTGIDISSETNTASGDYSATIAVDVSDFMTNGVDNRLVTATGTDAMNAEANLTFDGSELLIAGSLRATSWLWSQRTHDGNVGGLYLDNLSTHANATVFSQFRLDNASGAQKNAANIKVGKVQDWDSDGNTDAYMSFTTIKDNATSEVMRLQNDRVGIGTSSPATTLDVDGTVTATAFSGNATSASSVATAANSTDANQFVPFVDNSSGNQSLMTDAGLNYNPSSNKLNVGGAIDAGGNIDSTAQITAGSNIKANSGYLWSIKDSDATSTAIYLDNQSDGASSASRILFRQGYTAGGAVRNAASIQVDTDQQWTSTTTTNDSSLSFYTALNNTLAEKVRITSAGKLGIGTTDPTYEVDVRASTARLQVKSSGAAAFMLIDAATNNDPILYFRENGSNKWLIGNDADDDEFKISTSNSFTNPALKIATNGIVTAPALVSTDSITATNLISGGSLLVTTDITVGANIVHAFDADTKISFTTDNIDIYAGGVQMISMIEDGTQDKVIINEGAADVDFEYKNDAGTTTFKIEASSADTTVANLVSTGLVTATSDVQGANLNAVNNVNVAADIVHWFDTDTKIAFTTDQIDFYAGNVKMITLDETTQDTVVINEDSADIDFRVESNSDTHALFIQGSTGNVGLAASTPSARLHIAGTIDDVDLDAASGAMIIGDSSGQHLAFDDNEIMSKSNATTAGSLYLQNSGGYIRSPAVLVMEKDTDAEYIPLILRNKSDSSNTDGSISMQFDLEDTSGNTVDAGKIKVSKVQTFTSTNSTQDSQMDFMLSSNGNVSSYMTITSAATSVPGQIQATSVKLTGNQLYDSAGSLALITPGSGNLTVLGNINMSPEKKIIFDSADTYIASNDEDPEDLDIAADQDLKLMPDNDVKVFIGGADYGVFDGSVRQLALYRAVDGEHIPLRLKNQSDASNANASVSMQFDLEDTSGNTVDAGKIKVTKDQSFTSTAGTQDSTMGFWLTHNGTLTEKMTLSHEGVVTATTFSGNATTATTAANATSATTNSPQPTDDSTDTNAYVTFMQAEGAPSPPHRNDGLRFNASSGKLGVGATSPSYMVDVQAATGHLRVKSTGANSAYMLIDAGANTDPALYFRENGTNKWIIGNDADDDLFKFDNASNFASPAMTISTAGVVTATTFSGNATTATSATTNSPQPIVNSADVDSYVIFMQAEGAPSPPHRNNNLRYNASQNRLSIRGTIDDVDLVGDSGAFVIGDDEGQHLAFDSNEIMSKTSDTAAGVLHLQASGGTVRMVNSVDVAANTVTATTFAGTATNAVSATTNAPQPTDDSSNVDSYVIFMQAEGSPSPPHRDSSLRYNSSTNKFGIGTSSPSYGLDVHAYSSSFVQRLRNTYNIGDNMDGLKIEFAMTNDLNVHSHFIQVIDGDSDVQFEVRGDNNGGHSIGSSFTGTHDTACLMDEKLLPGMIVESTGEVWLKPVDKSFETALPRTRLTSTAKSRSVFGVVTGWPILGTEDERDAQHIVNGYVMRPAFTGYGKRSPTRETERHISVMAIGEGVVWVTNIGGEISNGDYVTSSPIKGMGQLQEDDILRSSTVAKITEDIDWSSVKETKTYKGQNYKKYLASCTFHCG